MRYKIYIPLLTLLWSTAGWAQEKMMMLEILPYQELYINIDRKPYYAAASCAVIPSIELGEHELMITDKISGNSENLSFTIEQLPAYFILSKSLDGYRLLPKSSPPLAITESGSSSPPPKYIDDITVKADSIGKKTDADASDCLSYNETEMDFIRTQYMKSRDKQDFLQESFGTKCVTPAQLQELLLASLTTKDRYQVLETLMPNVRPTPNIDEYSPYFKGTEFYSDFVKLKSKYGRQ